MHLNEIETCSIEFLNCLFLLGARVKNFMTHGHNHNPMYGVGASYSKTDAERFLHQLVLEYVLTEQLHVTPHESTCCYLRLGVRAADIMCGL